MAAIDAPAQALLDGWADDLASWAIPQEILDQAEEPPWAHAVSSFTVVGEEPDSPSHLRAREALPNGGSVLDVGSGGGRASSALIPPASMVVAVDHQQGMLDAFADMATARGARHHEYLGDWPDVADDAPECDVVVCHHVAYNVPAIGPFLQALDAHAAHRVVLEVPARHPLSRLNPLWKHFWGIDRPTRPAAEDLVAICRALGFDAQVEEWVDPAWANRARMNDAEQADFTRRKLCLPADRIDDVAAVLAAGPAEAPLSLATIWWDVRR